MPRVNRVKKSRKSPGSCGRCSKKIPKGSFYLHWKFRYGGKHLRCGACPYPRQSELTSSDKLSRCYGAGESVEDAVEAFRSDYDLETLKSAIEDAANEVREVADEYRESAENIESGFGHRTEMCDELEEKSQNLEGKADEMESVAGNLEEFSEPEDGDDEEKKKAKEEWVDDISSQCEECIDISPDG